MVTPLTIEPHLPRSTTFGDLEVCRILQFDPYGNRPLAMVVHNPQRDHYLALFYESRKEGDVWLYRHPAEHVIRIAFENGFPAIHQETVREREDYRVVICPRTGICTVEPAAEHDFSELLPAGWDSDLICPNED